MDKFTVILTAYKEAGTIEKAIEQIVKPSEKLWELMDLVVIAPDKRTRENARKELLKFKGFKNHKVVRDKAEGKPIALNIAASKASRDIFILTDGDMYISDNSISLLMQHFNNPEVGGVSGHPVSLDSRKNRFGYYSHLFCEAAHQARSTRANIPMSGYLYAFRNVGVFPLPSEIRSEDGFITMRLVEQGFKIEYEPDALAYVKFPKNSHDWFKQKTRSLGGNVQIKKYKKIMFNNQKYWETTSSSTHHNMEETLETNAYSRSPAGCYVNGLDDKTKEEMKKNNEVVLDYSERMATNSRSITEDLSQVLFPFKFASNVHEYWWSIWLYPMRLILWIKIYINDLTGKYSTGSWERIESSK